MFRGSTPSFYRFFLGPWCTSPSSGSFLWCCQHTHTQREGKTSLAEVNDNIATISSGKQFHSLMKRVPTYFCQRHVLNIYTKVWFGRKGSALWGELSRIRSGIKDSAGRTNPPATIPHMNMKWLVNKPLMVEREWGQMMPFG